MTCHLQPAAVSYIAMYLKRRGAIFLLLLSSLAAYGADSSKSELESLYETAFAAFDQARYDDALKTLDIIDARQPDLAESLNLRGVVYMRQGKYDKAEASLRKALTIEPRFWNASFNLAEIPFRKKNWIEARNRFEALMAGEHNGLEPETGQLIQYKILLTFLLQGKQTTADWMLNRFEQGKNSPALYYGNAAIAFQHDNQKEAAEWLSRANKQFSPALNKLYVESLYEIGWMERPVGESRAALEVTSEAERAERLKAEAKANFEKAERAFVQRDFDAAFNLLNRAEESTPNEAAIFNLRGEILMEQNKFNEAEVAFRKALAADGKFREAEYNLAQVAFKQGEYGKARDRFEALYAETPGDAKNQAAQLLKYKIFTSLLMEGKEADAQQLMDQFKFTGDTPALYYAQAAWEFKHGHPEKGIDWTDSARKIYSPALNIVFGDSLYDLGWLQKADSVPATSSLAQAEAAPASEAKPEMRVGQATMTPGPSPADDANASTPPASPTTSAAPVAVATIASSPTATAPSSAIAKPQAASPAEAAVSKKSSKPPWLQSAWPPDRSSDRRGLFIAALVVAGVLLLIWLVAQQVRRHAAAVSIYDRVAEPPAEPPVDVNELEMEQEPEISRHQVAIESVPATVQAISSETASSGNLIPTSPIAALSAAELTPSPNERKETGVPLPTGAAFEPQPPESITAFPEVTAPLARPAEEHADLTAQITQWLAKTQQRIGGLEDPLNKPADFNAVVEQSPGEAAISPVAPVDESERVSEEPVGQGEPIPELVTAFFAETIIPEITQPKPKSDLILESNEAAAAPLASHQPVPSSIETPSSASKTIITEHIREQAMTDTNVIPTPTFQPSTPVDPGQQASGGMHTAVQLTFSLEIASMKLTPNFKMSGLQLRPISKVVSMRLARTQDPQAPMNLQSTFEVAKIELSNGAIGSVRLAPSAQQKPEIHGSPSLAISGLQFVANQGAGPVQLTPSHREQSSVQLTAEFQIAAIEFTPRFELATIVLNSTSKRVALQLPGAAAGSFDNSAVFEIENAELGPGYDLALLHVRHAGL